MFEPRRSVQEGLDHLASRLDPIIADRLSEFLGGLKWTVILSELDIAKGYVGKNYDTYDLQAQLRVLTERLGGLKYPFNDPSRLVSTLGGELRIVRNRWAHNDEFAPLDAWRVHDFAARLLEHFNDADGMSVAVARRHEAIEAVSKELGIAPGEVDQAARPIELITYPSETDGGESVQPDVSVLIRSFAAKTPVIGAGRSEFEAWVPVTVGDVSILDALPKKAAKELVRAVAVEIAAFEGPIHIDRLSQLTGLAFGLRRLHSARAQKIHRQIKASGLAVDAQRFVWPDNLDPTTWSEFRPNGSEIDRPFLYISPVEIRNAARFMRRTNAGIDRAELEVRTLQTFGRKRRTKLFADHLLRSLSDL